MLKLSYLAFFFIRDGGPFSICFDDETLDKTEKLLYKRLNEITSCKVPKMVDPTQSSFKCTKICDYFKDGSCKAINTLIKKKGIGAAIAEHTATGHHVSNYNAPGEIKE